MKSLTTCSSCRKEIVKLAVFRLKYNESRYSNDQIVKFLLNILEPPYIRICEIYLLINKLSRNWVIYGAICWPRAQWQQERKTLFQKSRVSFVYCSVYIERALLPFMMKVTRNRFIEFKYRAHPAPRTRSTPISKLDLN